MQGVASNIAAMLDDRYHRSPFAEARTREEAPLEEAVAMLARERMTGLAPPRRRGASGRAGAALFEEKAGADLDRLATPCSISAPMRGWCARSFIVRARERGRRRQ